jgi:hypothetical protein
LAPSLKANPRLNLFLFSFSFVTRKFLLSSIFRWAAKNAARDGGPLTEEILLVGE